MDRGTPIKAAAGGDTMSVHGYTPPFRRVGWGIQWVTQGSLSREAAFGDKDYNHTIWKLPHRLCQHEFYTHPLFIVASTLQGTIISQDTGGET